MAKQWYTSKMLWVNAIEIVAIIAQMQFGFVIDPAGQVGLLATLNILLRAITGESLLWGDSNE